VASAGTALHLDEPCAHDFLGDGTSNNKIDGWFLDSGATHHMTGCREAWHGHKPAVGHLQNVSNLDDKSTLGVFIGYAEGGKAYHILDLETAHVRMARDVVFDEGQDWAWGEMVDDSSTTTYSDFVVDCVHFEGAGGVGSYSSWSVPTPIPRSPPTIASSPVTPAPSSTSAHDEPHLAEFTMPLSNTEVRVKAYNDGEPCPFAEAEGHAAWRAAMKREMDEGINYDDAPIAWMKSLRLFLALAAQEG
jgi:hypothetical protein